MSETKAAQTVCEWPPFHEGVVELIRMATPAGLLWAGALLRTVKIPANHDAIIEAWQESFYGSEEEQREELKYEETLEAIDAQKFIAEAEEAAKKEELVEAKGDQLERGDEFHFRGRRCLSIRDGGREDRSAVIVGGPGKGDVIIVMTWDIVQKIVRKGS